MPIFTNKEVETDDKKLDFGSRMMNAIDVQLISPNTYMSKELWIPFGLRGAYGGQIVAQALHAAWDTVTQEFFVHSLHAYFILSCNVEIPIIYNVQHLRDGRSFATRSVTATQNEKAVFVCSFSFAKHEVGITLNHQIDMPDVIDPNTLPSNLDLIQNALANVDVIPESFKKRARQKLIDNQPVDYRDIGSYTPEEFVTGNFAPSVFTRKWFKAKGVLNDDMKLHACIIAYASDYGFINSAARANGFSSDSDSIGMLSSLDHTMWFHHPTRADEWLLHDIHSPKTAQGRGVAFGRIYNRAGTLVATTAQEGILRLSAAEQARQRKQAESDQQLLQKSDSNSRL